MKTSSLDLLEKSQLPPAQARAILRVMESEIALRDTALATRADLHATKEDLQSGFHSLELKLEGVRTDIQVMRAEVKSEIKGTIRWNFAFWITQLATMAGILKLLK